MSHIVKLAPERVVYVSCNPTTLARDSKVLLSAGYRLARVRMLDMFRIRGILSQWRCLLTVLRQRSLQSRERVWLR
jgi:hypothetical protein